MKIKSVIIDDEVHNLENLKRLLENNCPDVNVLDVANSVEEGLELIRNNAIDLVFLDIEMPNKNGFDFLEAIDDINFEVIFVTAYNQYALKAIKSCALDYLMKPVAISELKEAVLKVSEVVANKLENQKLKTLMDNLKQINKPQKIALPTAEELYFVSIEDIVRCKAENNYTQFFLTNNTTVLVSKTLKEWDDLLSSNNFIRTHQSHLINAVHVKSFVKKDGGYILMNDGSMVSVSKGRKEKTLNQLASFN